MSRKQYKEPKMLDVPELDFFGALSEMWSQISCAAYHFAYVRVYSQSASLQTSMEVLRQQAPEHRNDAQTYLIICRTHLAAFFWQLEHLFEALRTAIKRGKCEHPETTYFIDYLKYLNQVESLPIRRQIKSYRNLSHQVPAVIGVNWESPNKFHHLFLPDLTGHPQRKHVDINVRLQEYFEFTANVWLDFSPNELRERFPRDFTFPVTIPNHFLGELPKELSSVPYLQVTVKSHHK